MHFLCVSTVWTGIHFFSLASYCWCQCCCCCYFRFEVLPHILFILIFGVLVCVNVCVCFSSFSAYFHIMFVRVDFFLYLNWCLIVITVPYGYLCWGLIWIQEPAQQIGKNQFQYFPLGTVDTLWWSIVQVILSKWSLKFPSIFLIPWQFISPW